MKGTFGEALPQLIICPDCNSTTEMVELAPNVYTAAVIHDDTCPWLNRKERHGKPRT